MTSTHEITALLRNHLPDIGCTISEDGTFHAEFGGEIPSSLVNKLQSHGAEVLLYRHHGTVATVVTF